MRKIYFLFTCLILTFSSAIAQVNAFPGSDFEDFEKFKSGLNRYGLKNYATQGKNKGVDGSNSLNIAGIPTGNDYVFTANLGAVLKSKPKEITFWVKGTSEGKSISINVYKTDGKFYAFNIGNLTEDTKIESSVSNQYTGSIDTNNKWVKVILNLSDKNDLNTSDLNSSFFALKVGRNGNYLLDIDNVQLWDESLNTQDLTPSKSLFNTLWENEAVFNVKEKTAVEVYNIHGQLVKSFEIKGSKTINVSDLLKGVYIVKTSSNGKTTTQKVLKK